MELRKASRKKAKIRLGLQGPSGSGKTYSSLLIAFGLCGDYSRVAVIDTESNSADLYSHLGEFKVLNLTAPFTPEKYKEAIQICEKAGVEVIIVDSLSHEWEGPGGILDIHNRMVGNSFTNWGKITPRHNAFVTAILRSGCHVIGTSRTKHDYVLSEKNGKMVPEKVGLKAVQRENLEYDFTLVFDLDTNTCARASKDRTGMFIGTGEEQLSIEIGQQIAAWCNEGTEPKNVVQDILILIATSDSVEDLLVIFKSHPDYQDELLPKFTERRSYLEGIGISKTNLKNQTNGTINSQ